MKSKMILAAAFAAISQLAFAGGILTNTNQNIAYNRMMSREAAIGIDGAYYNPAGVAFLSPGHHFSFNWQTAIQSRTIENDYPLFGNNTADNSTHRKFRGKAFAPVLPSVQYAYNWHNFSFQANGGLIGGGGKCTFDDGLGSFEKIVGETALGAVGLAGAVDQALGQQMFTSPQMFGTDGKYSFNSYMRGNSYYYGFSVGAAYRLRPNLSFFGGVRAVYATGSYYGYVRNIKVGNMPLYKVLDPSKTNSGDIELNCDQKGLGFTPIISIDYRLGRWNFAAKYEFKTRMRLKNESVNQAPSIGNLQDNLGTAVAQTVAAQAMKQDKTQTMTQTEAMAYGLEYAKTKLSDPRVVGAMGMIKQQFDSKMTEATGEYADGVKVPADIPALLSVGVGYNPVDPLRVNVGFHYFYDKQATAYNHREEKLKRGTMEWTAGAEFDASKRITVSAGWQNTNYGLSEAYMNDKSFVVSSNSVACGARYHVTKRMDINVAYFHTFYQHKKNTDDVALSSTQAVTYKSDYTRDNNVFGVGVDYIF